VAWNANDAFCGIWMPDRRSIQPDLNRIPQEKQTNRKFSGMTPEKRQSMLKKISFVIGACGSVKPETQALAALEAIETEYELIRKPQQ